MSTDPFAGLVGDQVDVEHYIPTPRTRPPGSTDRPDPTGKTYMLLEDLRLHALPYGSGTRDAFTVRSSGKAIDALIINALPSRTYHHDELSRALRDYIETALWHLALGALYLRIEYFRPAADPSGPPVAFRLKVLEEGRIHRRFGRMYCWTPMLGDGESESTWTRKVIDQKAIVTISLPRKLRTALKRTLQLVHLADQDLDVIQRFTIGPESRNSAFDLSVYQRRSADVILRETREIGWTGRGLFTEGLLDPMKVTRAIQFARTTARLRDFALAGLQEAVDRAGKIIGFEARLDLIGVLTDSDLDRLENDLRAGTRPISEMLVPGVPE